ncbi:MAG: hypothetical protein UY23_C0001G0349 [Candidatus Jorgensenbacteria bacterium GW2011_GWA1_48_11]|uniref:Uncharacterized protein n=1 Tax=Candidatus Jorgensenbacteria bacterium GW2011_GWA1_48_11 TaxID=1618660 RepID=A0A0G1WN19_9BACT|nr:MAG: hypothetical protein UY23_C0001G0349 [Candidatus Jorgensenbacteria bacterium GW2011_GWA1_48_11]KKW12234.1 MAG: hypothetical protein UY51_C0005G0476 [Candidatus Jorgensenbacteria bacterium GW2011_GWB1_49_9]
MNFLQTNFILIFGVISLIGIVFAASGLAKTSIEPFSTSLKDENTAPQAAQEPGPKPEQVPVPLTKTQTRHQIAGTNPTGNAKG